MNKSFIDRIFPHSPSSVLPQYHDDFSSHTSASSSPPRIALKDSLPPSVYRPSSSKASLRVAPLSASIVHHDDPLLLVDRAAKSLQRNIQSFLDAQSEALNASTRGTAADDLSSVGSPTPTPSVATPARSHAGLKTVPIRQPRTKSITVRGARKGLLRAMEELVHLKEEELRIIDQESTGREFAIRQTRQFEEKRRSIESEISSISNEDSAIHAASLRAEAAKVEAESQELENKLFEMRTRHRQLVTQAEHLENSVDSKLSSYKSSLALIEKNVRHFLRRPPVSTNLSIFDENGTTRGGTYALKPDRRTLDVVQYQWTIEQDLLSQRKGSVEGEREALQEGAKIWGSITDKIADLEKELRRALRSKREHVAGANGETDISGGLLDKIKSLIACVSAALATAESKNWNLLICCLGAELESLEEARLILGGKPEKPGLMGAESNSTIIEDEPPADLLNGSVIHRLGSNQSLQDTLKEFAKEDKGKQTLREEKYHVESPPQGSSGIPPPTELKSRRDYRSESEDDDPGPDFFLSHS